jgi:two-component system response regulator FixJ
MSDFPVYLVDDDESVRRSLGFLLSTARLKAQAFASGTAFLKEVKSLDPGCILLDIRMPEIDGLQVQAELAERGIAWPVVVMTGHGDVETAVKAMKAGAVDFIEKPFEKQLMLDAIEEGFTRLGRADAKSTRREEARLRLNGLTARELDVLKGLVDGYPNKTIGYDLGISSRTVEIHRANLMKKLEVNNLSDLLRIAFSAGIGEETAPQG